MPKQASHRHNTHRQQAHHTYNTQVHTRTRSACAQPIGGANANSSENQWPFWPSATESQSRARAALLNVCRFSGHARYMHIPQSGWLERVKPRNAERARLDTIPWGWDETDSLDTWGCQIQMPSSRRDYRESGTAETLRTRARGR